MNDLYGITYGDMVCVESARGKPAPGLTRGWTSRPASPTR